MDPLRMRCPPQKDTLNAWNQVASLSFPMGRNSAVTACELESCLWGLAFVTSLMQDTEHARHCLHEWVPLVVDKFPILHLTNLIKFLLHTGTSTDLVPNIDEELEHSRFLKFEAEVFEPM